jgi:hypothetical protein
MAKKIFIISSVASGSGYAVKFTAKWARATGASKVHTLGGIRTIRKLHKIEDTSITRISKYLDTKVFEKYSSKYANILTGWKIAYYLDELYSKYGQDATFIFVRHAPETAEVFVKKTQNRLTRKMNKPLSVEELTAIGITLDRKIEAFMAKHSLTWTTVGKDALGANLELQSSQPTNQWLEMSMLKGSGF